MNYKKCGFWIFVFLFSSLSAISCSKSKDTVVANLPVAAANNYATNTPPNEPNKFMTVKMISADEAASTTRVNLTYAHWDSFPQFRNNTGYYAQIYCLSNSQKLDENTAYSYDEEMMKLCFTVDDAKPRENLTPLAAGTYYAASDSEDFGRVSVFQIHTNTNKQRGGGSLDLSHAFGTLVIENSTKNFISGKISLSDNRYSVNGEFACDIR